MIKSWRFFVVLFLSGSCCACFEREITTELAPVSSGVASERPSYVVRQGDTLFSIAWKFDKDHKALAYYNHLAPNAPLMVGQTIKLVSNKGATGYFPVRQDHSTTNNFKTQSKPQQGSVYSKVPVKAHDFKTQPQFKTWYWPAKGQVAEKFSVIKHQKGINIKGNAGSPIFAAKDGVVAYSGNGLRGYGNLVILRHDDLFLSAYAFNQKILVKEGEKVKAKQKIAEMGKSKGGNGRLHFEIRKKGQPIDPLKFLDKH